VYVLALGTDDYFFCSLVQAADKKVYFVGGQPERFEYLAVEGAPLEAL
jgi:hypothetical protein